MTMTGTVFVKRTSFFFVLLSVLTASSLLTGCGFIHRHFSKKDDSQYQKAVEERPLEVPPDLDTPNGSGALVVPSASTAAKPAAFTTSTSASAPATAGAAAASAPPSVATATGTVLGDELHVADTVDNVWSRVGLALERSDTTTIQSRNEGDHSYMVQTTGQTSTKPGWFKKVVTLGRAGKKETAKVVLTVRVSADDTGSRVSIEGADDDTSKNAARALLDTLRPGLDTPNGSGAQVVPSTSTAAKPAASTASTPASAPATAEAAATPAPASAPPPVAAAAGTVLGDELHVADTVDNVWPRVGLVLEHSDAATIQSRNEGDHTRARRQERNGESRTDGTRERGRHGQQGQHRRRG
jgi:uncharacterized lipoprotein